ncbi:MAG TPA: hypothetical protein VGJ22_06675 [Anaerolineales bacterium]
MKSTSTIERLSRRDLLILAAALLLGAAAYLVASAVTYRIGFPLDDAWIHQTYARNLALHGEWAFRLGEPSAGSTAPLWSALLAIGFLLRLAPYIWTYALGMLCLWTLAVAVEGAARHFIPTYRPRWPLAGLLILFEWHLLWSALSGMETILHALILAVILVALMQGSRRFLTLGLLTGLSVWVRPDGLTLLGPALLTILLIEKDWRARLPALATYLIGFGIFFALYLLFNLIIGGTPMPNTFYAKQAEYAAWQSRPIVERLLELALQLLSGPGLFLIPGALRWGWLAARRRSWGTLAAMMWCFGYMWLYVSRLPVYQHGRYIMPVLPMLVLWGFLGVAEFSQHPSSARLDRIARLAWYASIGFTTLGFVFIGANAYRQDVALIESEMVVAAKWAAVNIPPGELIAAHDIGALGYYDQHPLLDLAGLISPEVVPFIRDEARLSAFLDERGADYLIAFPEFYPHLVQAAQPVFSTRGRFAPQFHGKNMVIYRWSPP